MGWVQLAPPTWDTAAPPWPWVGTGARRVLAHGGWVLWLSSPAALR